MDINCSYANSLYYLIIFFTLDAISEANYNVYINYLFIIMCIIIYYRVLLCKSLQILFLFMNAFIAQICYTAAYTSYIKYKIDL
jgi:hypothetical protein